jgi:hypothetical protein
MTGEELIELLERLIGEAPDQTRSIQLLNTSKNRTERDHKLLICQETDESQTANPGETYLSTKNLPTGWRGTVKMVVGTTPYLPIPFRNRIAHRNSARRYYIDVKNNRFALCGTVGSAKTICHTFIKKTDDYTTDNLDETIITWPEEFHALVAYDAAAVYLGIDDLDTINNTKGRYSAAEHQRLLDGLIAWNADLQLAEMGGALGYADDDDLPEDIGLM